MNTNSLISCILLAITSFNCIAHDSPNAKVVESIIHSNVGKNVPKSKVSALINMDEFMGDCQQEIYKAKVEGVQFSPSGKTLESFRFNWRGNQMVVPTNIGNTGTLSNVEMGQASNFIRVGKTYLIHFQLCGNGYPSLINIYDQSGSDTSAQTAADNFNQNSMRPLPPGEVSQSALSSTDPSVISYYVGLMSRKIRSNINPSSCPASNPEIMIDMKLSSNGDFNSEPAIVKSSGDAKCDEATLRGVMQAKPFDLPYDHPNELSRLLEPMRLKLKPGR